MHAVVRKDFGFLASRFRGPVLYSLAAVAIVGAGAVAYGRHTYDSVVDRIEIGLDGRVGITAEYVARTFESVDILLQSVATAREQDLRFVPRPEAQVVESLNRALSQVGHLRSISIIDTSGQPSISTLGLAGRQINTADRDYFVVHKLSSASELYLSRPARSRIDGTWIISASRRISDPSGKFAGVAAAIMEARSFEAFSGAREVSGNAYIALVNDQGTVISLTQPNVRDSSDATGKPLNDLTVFSDLGLGFGVGLPTDSKRLSKDAVIGVIRSVPRFSFAVIAAIPRSAVIQAWIEEVAVEGIAILLFVAALIFLTVFGARHAIERSKAEAERDRLFELSPDIVCVCDFVGRFLRVSPSAEWVTGYSVGELLTMRYTDLIHADDRNAAVAAFRSVRTGNTVFDLETRIVRKDGSNGWLSWSVVASDERLYVISRDVTKRRESDNRMHNLMAFQGAVLDAASNAVIAVDHRGKITLFNPAAEALLGVDAPSVVGRENLTMFFDRNEIEERSRMLSAQIGRQVAPDFDSLSANATSGRADVREWRLRTWGGRLVPVILSVSSLRDDAGRLTGFLAIATDITARREAESRLRDSEAKLRAIFDNVVDGVITIDSGGTIENLNPAAERIFGYPAREAIGQNVTLLMPEAYREQHNRTLQTYSSKRATGVIGITRELEGRRRDGTVFPLEIAVGAIETPRGILFTGLLRDITERKRIERMKNEFVSTVSHELRTPLTSIQGSLGLVAGGVVGDVPEKARQLLEIAHKNSQRLVLLVNDILDIQKIESGRLDMRLTVFPVAQLIEQAVLSNQAFAERQGVELKVEDVVDDAEISADFDRLIQVMTNLLSNAAKFSPSGSEVRIGAWREGTAIRVSVADQGPGISDEFRPRVFEKFAQADATDSRQKTGTGLGLSIAKALVESLGGSIGFQSEPGKGAVFHFDIPEYRPAAVAPLAGAADRDSVLIVEDEPSVAEIIRVMLSADGFDADVAHGADQARVLLAGRRYRAMTLDLQLPDKSGLGFLRSIRQKPETSDMPVVVISALPPVNSHEMNGEALGIIDWLEKPIDRVHLAAALRRAMAMANNLRPTILHVEDDSDLRMIVGSILGEEADIRGAGTVAEARESLRHHRFDLVILDVGMPDGNGLDLLDEIKGATPSTPVLIFSAQEWEYMAGEAISAALVKSRTTNEKLRRTIRDLIGGRTDAAPPKVGA